MIGRFISDLEKGDRFVPLSFIVTSAEASEFAAGFGESAPWFHESSWSHEQYVPPTMIQGMKTRLLVVACPDGDGPHPKLIVSYHARHRSPIPVNRSLTLSGEVLDRYSKRGRTYVRFGLELVESESGKLLVEYIDEQLLGFAPEQAT